ncbi:EamA family transporter [Cytophagaceae bacterium YF14B1]|uniref:EamA family transporter n=1 Tax=Xanthocytophaga flava TaxID=3048013 RepID=A0AAE3U864_9BACT|nr:EamA family transporter [Xanthocytophaga flavus]MDJ1483689.1 EamA family transporter [Xanthocytophaga flavus]
MTVITAPQPTRMQIVLALLAVYIIWGSTYLFIHFMTEVMPPLLMSGIRNVIAGGLLYLFARFRSGGSVPEFKHWRSATLLGFMLLAVANGGLAIALRLIPSGIGALLTAMLPLWIVILNWLAFNKQKPSIPTIAGLGIGLIGFLVLIGPTSLSSGLSLNWVGVVIVMIGVASWGTATLLAPRLPLHPSQLQATSMQMFAGGVLLLVFSFFYEHPTLAMWNDLTPKAGWSLIYLIVFGSWIGFTAYAWLAQNAPPHITSTYAYVNPVVAMLLGWAFAGEKLTDKSLIAAAIIICAVVIITSQRKAKKAVVE